MTTARIELPPKLVPVFTAEGVRTRGAYGGRGSAKTRSFALMTAVRGMMLAEARESGSILCAREFMNSLDESSMEEVKIAIRSVPWLDNYYDIGERYIRTRNKRINYIFSGLRHNLESIKSKARVHLAWVDEAEQVSESAWLKLEPTVREPESEIWVTWNPEKDGSPTDKRYRKNPSNAAIVEMNYWDNPFFPDTLDAVRKRDQDLLDPATYAHVWEGAYLENSNAQVLVGKVRVAEFTPEPNWSGPYHGLDFGFSQDPTAAVKCWVHQDRLWVEYDACKVGLELDQTAEYVEAKIPGISSHVIRADSARPESISYLQRHGLNQITSVSKWSGSVDDGIKHLRSYAEIVIHPRCNDTIREARLYSYKVDRLTGDVLPTIVDSNNHCMDAIRYAIQPLIKHQPIIFRAL